MNSDNDKKSEDDDELLEFLRARDCLQLPMVDLSCCGVPERESSAKSGKDEETSQ